MSCCHTAIRAFLVRGVYVEMARYTVTDVVRYDDCCAMCKPGSFVPKIDDYLIFADQVPSGCRLGVGQMPSCSLIEGREECVS